MICSNFSCYSGVYIIILSLTFNYYYSFSSIKVHSVNNSNPRTGGDPPTPT